MYAAFLGPRHRVTSIHAVAFDPPKRWVTQTPRAAVRVAGDFWRQRHVYNARIAPRDRIPLRPNDKQPRAVLCAPMQGSSQLSGQYHSLNLWYFPLTLSLPLRQAPQYFLVWTELFCAVFKAATSAL